MSANIRARQGGDNFKAGVAEGVNPSPEVWGFHSSDFSTLNHLARWAGGIFLPRKHFMDVGHGAEDLAARLCQIV